MNRTLIWVIIILAIVIIGVGGYFAFTNNTAAPSSPVLKGVVNIQNSAFDPVTITINKGETVTWRNNDTYPHRIAAEDGSFDLGDMAGGKSSKHKFDQKGTFKYYCKIHTFMKGTVVVK